MPEVAVHAFLAFVFLLPLIIMLFLPLIRGLFTGSLLEVFVAVRRLERGFFDCGRPSVLRAPFRLRTRVVVYAALSRLGLFAYEARTRKESRTSLL